MPFIKILSIGLLCVGLLIGCGKEEKAGDSSNVSNKTEEETPSVPYTNLEDINLDDENFNWENVHLKKSDVKKFLKNMKDESAEEYMVSSAQLTGKHEITMTINTDKTRGDMDEDFEAAFSIGMMILVADTMTRQIYIHSDYKEQPEIIFVNNKGDILASNTDFIEMETGEATDIELNTN